MSTTETQYQIEAHGEVSTGPMRPVAEHLAEYLGDFEAVLRVHRGEGEGQDFERLELEGVEAGEGEAAWEYLDTFALEVHAHETRCEILLTCGGPHVVLDVLRSITGEVDEVILRRYWGGERDRAWTEDGRACELVRELLEVFGTYDA